MRLRLLSLAALALSACSPEPATAVRDCETCPVMVELPTGKFLMGTAEADRLIDPRTGKPAKNDGPQHEVTVQSFAIGKHEVTVGEYRAFVDATHHQSVGGCMAFGTDKYFTISTDVDWDEPGFAQSADSPVGCVSFFDAQAYTDWLSETTGKYYRLPTEAEWEYAARAGATTPYHWGDDPALACEYANVRSAGADAISKRQAESDSADGFPCDDGVKQSAPVGSYRPNDFGLFDMQGNAWEWVADCIHKDYNGAPTDGSAWLDDTPCQFGVIRSGSFLNRVERSSTTVRAGRPRSGKATNMGFRIARGGDRGPPRSFGAVVPQRVVEQPRQQSGAIAADDEGARLFADNCAACHVEEYVFKGLYGKDQASLVRTIRDGGNNVMSMPAFSDRLSPQEIEALATYLRNKHDW
ncbi:MAG: SUMF1/EgtB/PvdO family nonheme iron enzyme [Gammaproteobacteria bacterium]|nr:SUMF1/EgtB/PvdO family nonheme iron enzyme [Gammaproteobacteria bacterium]